MTERQKWALEFLEQFRAGGLSGELVIRFRDGEPVEVVPSPKYRPPQAGRRARESGR